MGVTYLGQRAKDPVKYAVKIVTPTFVGSPAQIEEFLREVRPLTKLDHPHIIRLRDIGVCPNGFYFAAEYLPGLNAAQVLEREGPLSVQRAARWANHMLKGLHHAHEQRFVHHDIKPTNVIVAQIEGKEVVKLADFAVARIYQAAPFSGLSLTAAMLDLASFIPPERLFNFQEINPLADQYSLAAVLYHLLTNAPLLDLPKEERKRYTSLLRRQYTPLRERRADVPAKLAEVVHQALSRTPNKRFANMAEFRHALVHAMQAD
jgi:serine/threonine-protein kinase